MIRLDRVLKMYRIDTFTRVVLNRVSLVLESGHSYALLGVNGAGKTTLIKLIAGIELPNGGRLQRNVRVSWPIGFAGGLHPQLTARENAQFVASVYGEDRAQVVGFVEDFAEIGAYFDAPIYTYSSGMLARVAFGLSMAISFDCYLVDEIMSVGDGNFRDRCAAEFGRRRASSDIILASHDMATVREYCDRGIVLASGTLHCYDRIDDAIERYIRLNK
jgi:capsular polysaccharide transport system ATP-binding protein